MDSSFARQSVSRLLARLAVILLLLGNAPRPLSADFQNSYLRFDRMKASTISDVVVVLTPATAGSEASVEVAFDAKVTVSGSPSVNTSNLPTGVSALPGTLSASAAGQVVTVSGVSDLSVGTSYGFRLTSTATTGVAGSYKHTLTTKTGGGSTVDTSRLATSVIADDQIVVTAVVPPTFDFSLDGNTDSFSADLDLTAVVSTAGRKATVLTNAPSGWVMWARSANQGLSSAVASYTINTSGTIDGSPSTLSTGTNGYVLDADIDTDSGTGGSGTVTIAGEYNGSGTNQGGTLAANYEAVASADGPTDGDSILFTFRATVGGLTPAAGDYTDTITLVGAGVF